MSSYPETTEKLIELYENGASVTSVFPADEVELLLASSDWEIRYWLAKCLFFEPDSATATKILSILAEDDEEMVRVQAVDSLCNFIIPQAYDIMKKSLRDSSECVRGYAAFGLALLGRDLYKTHAKVELLSMAKQEGSLCVQVSIWEGLYLLGEKESLTILCDIFSKSDDYRVQCSVLNALKEILCMENHAQMLSFVGTLHADAFPRAVRESIDDLMSNITELQF